MVEQSTPEATSIIPSRPWKSNLSSEDISGILESQNLSYMSSAWPTVIYLSVLMAAGVAGNSLVLLVYSRKVKSGVTRFYILAMAVCDLATNCFSLPMEMLDIHFQYTFWSNWGCKVAWTLVCFILLLAFFLLLAMAVNRQRVICRQLQHTRLASSREHKAVPLCVAFSLILSSPMLWLLATEEVHFPDTNVTGVRCYYVGDPTFRTAYGVILSLTVITGLVVMCVSHGRIARHVWAHNRRQRAARVMFKRGSPDGNDAVQIELQGDTPEDDAAQTPIQETSVTCTDTGLSEEPDPSFMSNIQAKPSYDAGYRPDPCTDASTMADEVTSDLEEDKNMAGRWILARLCSRLMTGRAGDGKIDAAHSSKARQSRSRVRKVSNRTTLMLFTLTVVFCVNYIPHLLTVVMRAILSPQAVLDLLGFNVYKMMRSSTYINSAINPIVYSFCSLEFRRSCRRLLGCRKA